jgi:ABC-type branched-subunit amino acid transport system substrate-binding protein
VVTVANNMKSLGLNKMLLLGSINETDILTSAGKVIGDQYLFPAALIQLASNDLSVITKPTSRAAAEAFVKAAKAKPGSADSAQAARAWDSVMMMVAAMKKANTVEGTAVRDTFEKLGSYDGAGASYDFSATQHVGITHNPYVIAVVKDGKLALKK